MYQRVQTPMVDRLLQGSTALMHVFKGKKCLQKGGNDPIIIMCQSTLCVPP